MNSYYSNVPAVILCEIYSASIHAVYTANLTLIYLMTPMLLAYYRTGDPEIC
jgi:hypothetical protein